MTLQDGVKGTRDKKVCVFAIGVLYFYYSIYLTCVLWFIMYFLSLDKLADLLIYLSLHMMSSISVKLVHVSQSVSVWIGKQLCNSKATTSMKLQLLKLMHQLLMSELRKQ